MSSPPRSAAPPAPGPSRQAAAHLPPHTSIAQALQSATGALATAGVDSPRLDAELLLGHVLGVGRERLLLDRDLAVPRSGVQAYQDAVRRRAADREPVAYITGRRAFRHLELRVDRRALIPRPETEGLVEAALALPEGASVLDVGTGCGAVALALAQERPDLRISASDVSVEALSLARENGRRLGLAVQWLSGDLLDGLPDRHRAIVANLPYVAPGELAGLTAEIVRHEPRRALLAHDDGLALIARLLAQAGPRAVEMVALEVGSGQFDRASIHARRAGFGRVRSEPDLAGIERVLVAER